MQKRFSLPVEEGPRQKRESKLWRGGSMKLFMAGKEGLQSWLSCVVVFDKQSWQKEENYALDAHFHQRKGTSAAAQPKSL
jgi:hypothetical protein